MTKRQKQPKGLTDSEFGQLVDEGFQPTPPGQNKSRWRTGRGGARPDALSESTLKQLEREGHVAGLSKSEARFNGAIGRLYGGVAPKADPGTIKFLKGFDLEMRQFAKHHGYDVRDDE